MAMVGMNSCNLLMDSQPKLDILVLRCLTAVHDALSASLSEPVELLQWL